MIIKKNLISRMIGKDKNYSNILTENDNKIFFYIIIIFYVYFLFLN